MRKFIIRAVATGLATLTVAGSTHAQPYYDRGDHHHYYSRSRYHYRHETCGAARRRAGNQGAALGAVSGGVLGGVLGHGLVGGLVGGGVGAVAGHEIAKGQVRC